MVRPAADLDCPPAFGTVQPDKAASAHVHHLRFVRPDRQGIAEHLLRLARNFVDFRIGVSYLKRLGFNERLLDEDSTIPWLA